MYSSVLAVSVLLGQLCCAVVVSRSEHRLASHILHTAKNPASTKVDPPNAFNVINRSASSRRPSPTLPVTGSTTPSVTPATTPYVTSSVSPSVSPSRSSSAAESASPSPTPSITPITDDLLRCEGLRTRKEIRLMKKQERTEWALAIVKVMENQDQNNMSGFTNLFKMYRDNWDEAHSGSYFLPWNRFFLLRMENALRKKNPRMSLPYWDWTQDADDMTKSVLWDKAFFDDGNYFTTPGMFVFYPLIRMHRVTRWWGKRTLSKVVSNEKWEDFSDAIEAATVLAHSAIGGAMATKRSAHYPLFYLVHSFVDYLYFQWQNAHGKTKFGGTHDFTDSVGTQKANSDRDLKAFGVPVKDAFVLSCVQYERAGKNRKEASGRNSSDFDSTTCTQTAVTKAHFMEEARCRRGEEILERMTSR